MSNKTAGLWKQAMESERDVSEIQAQLAELNQELNWDRENLREDISTGRTQVRTDG
ncbi:uncharacterized protein HfgLR_20780 (plasmid) [Haloferax gibbonsii]|uniref:Uncharacterized protein n=1 Tax=Haloferax gibbonsii TaxID=35746 RepID=A0A871BKR7_HALGI|nr:MULTISPECIES: hypothetical protein [Haloferax]QOS13396.1 uncharacterized protein HfgLR_20780 [Haloferax gibbonsii]